MTGRIRASCPPGPDVWLRRGLVLAGMLAVHLLVALVVRAQDVTAPALKAAFIYNFVKFTEWPDALPASDPFVVCVIGDSAVAEALARVVAGRDVAGHRMETLVVSRPTRACAVLYVSGTTASVAAQAIAGLQDSPVLTISDIAGFVATGGMAQFFFERGQLRFSIKAETVKRSRLKMSSKLLTLGQR